MSSAESLRASASDFAPSFSNRFIPDFSAIASVGVCCPPSAPVRGGAKLPPLSEIAFWNSPFAAGDAPSMLTAIPPADSPKIVTLRGSPPNAAMLSLTHARPAIMSCSP